MQKMETLETERAELTTHLKNITIRPGLIYKSKQLPFFEFAQFNLLLFYRPLNLEGQRIKVKITHYFRFR